MRFAFRDTGFPCNASGPYGLREERHVRMRLFRSRLFRFAGLRGRALSFKWPTACRLLEAGRRASSRSNSEAVAQPKCLASAAPRFSPIRHPGIYSRGPLAVRANGEVDWMPGMNPGMTEKKECP